MNLENPQNFSRRKFIKTAGVVLGAAILKTTPLGGESIEEKGLGQGLEIKTNEEEIKKQIEKCTQIIKSEKYEEIISNPYLVSALFYSGAYIKTIKPPHENGSEKIIWSIYPLITRQFRENYLNKLKEIVGKSPTLVNSSKESSPLDSIHIGKNLEENHLDGIDLFIEEGSLVYSMSGGIVVLAENGWKMGDDLSTSTTRGGNTVIIFNPSNDSFYRYAHMQKTAVFPGNILQNGETVGVVGHTGINASKEGHGKHLHLEINKYSKTKGKMMPVDVYNLAKKLKHL